MDLEILHATKGDRGLDDVMKAMYDEYYTKQGRGFTDAEFKSMAEKIAGKSFDKIYNDYVNGTKMIDYDLILGYAGMELDNSAAQRNEPYLGVAAANRDGKVMVTSVSRNSPAWNDGLNVNDEIIGIDGYRVSDVDKSVAMKKVGDKIIVLVSRDGILRNLEVTLVRNPNLRNRIVPIDKPTAQQLKVRTKWLSLDNID
jgi:predicted metalloprotease with PDZ domain